VTLKDAKNGIAAVFVDESFDLRGLPVGPPEKAEALGKETLFRLPPILKPGEYVVYFSIGTRTGTPRLALPLRRCEKMPGQVGDP